MQRQKGDDTLKVVFTIYLLFICLSRHPEFISGSKMPKQVLHDGGTIFQLDAPSLFTVSLFTASLFTIHCLTASGSKDAEISSA
jgi:hypothetical protein